MSILRYRSCSYNGAKQHRVHDPWPSARYITLQPTVVSLDWFKPRYWYYLCMSSISAFLSAGY